MGRAYTLAAATACLLGCKSGDASQVARDAHLMQAALAEATVTDTAELRRGAEFDKCAYVYRTEGQLRECLVMTRGWTPSDAERRIVRYVVDRKRIADSLDPITDSLNEVANEAARRAREEEAARQIRTARLEAARQDSLDRASMVLIELRPPDTPIEVTRQDAISLRSLIVWVRDGNGYKIKTYRVTASLYYPDERRTLHWVDDSLPLELGANDVTVVVNGVPAGRSIRYIVR